MTTYAYPDAYLTDFITEDVETRAGADVVLMAGARTFSATYIERLTILQAYIIACIENQAEKDDLFHVKLRIYRDQLAVELGLAITDADATSGALGGGAFFSLPMERA